MTDIDHQSIDTNYSNGRKLTVKRRWPGWALLTVGVFRLYGLGSLLGEIFERHSMAKRQACCNKERILVSTRWSKLPRYRTMFVIVAIEIRKSNHLSQHATSLATIFARPFIIVLFFWSPCTQYGKKRAQEHSDV